MCIRDSTHTLQPDSTGIAEKHVDCSQTSPAVTGGNPEASNVAKSHEGGENVDSANVTEWLECDKVEQ